MELVQDHQRHPVQHRITLQHAGQHAFRHHLQAGVRPYAILATHTVTDRLAQRLTQLLRQTMRHTARGQSPWLQHDDASVQRRMAQ